MKNNLFVLLSALILSSCQQQAEETQTESKAEVLKVTQVATTVEKTETTEAKEENEPFDFTYNDLDGKPVSLSDYRGKWVVVNFWATWCPPCRKEIPDFVKFKAQYGDKVEILGINNEDADVEIVRAFVEDYNVNYPILRTDVYNPLEFDRQNTMGLPTTVIFNPEGIQVSKRVGPMHFKDLQLAIGVSVSATP